MPKVKGLTRKQAGFVKDILEGKNATQAVKNNYNVSNDLTARVIGSENLTKPNIMKAIGYPEEVVIKAKKKIEQLMYSAEQETVQLSAAKDIIDRSEGKANQNVDIKTNGESLNESRNKSTDELLARLAQIRSLKD